MLQRRTSAFTLIELLVVIAIIAILAAILFPVFAQAKLAAKKTAAISQAKQIATATLIYTGDADDTAPLGVAPNLATVADDYKPDVFTFMSPNGWFANPIIQDEHAVLWHNSTEPYRKNYDILDFPGMRAVNIAGYPPTGATQLRPPKGANLTYNGHLESYSMTAIAAPSQLPMFWQGQGNITRVGAAMTNPRLSCRGTGPCRYNPGGPPQGDMAANARGDVFNIFLGGETSYYTYGRGNIFVSADSSARVFQVGDGNRGPSPASQNRIWPIQFVQPDGTVRTVDNFIRGRFAGQSLHTAAFMPDNTYAN